MTLVDASHTPDQPTSPEMRVSEAGSAKTPLKARLSLLRQQIILTLRYYLRPFYRIPMDDIKEQQIEQWIGNLMQNDRNFLEQLNKLIEVSNQMQSRLSYYEKRDPSLAELRKRWEHEQKRLAGAIRDAHESGILTLTPSNGNGRIVRP